VSYEKPSFWLLKDDLTPLKMLKRRDTKMSSKGKENINPASIELSRDDKPKELVTQILKDRYMDPEKMQKFLKSEFGNDWKLEVRLST
jgi:hypothetical protein